MLEETLGAATKTYATPARLRHTRRKSLKADVLVAELDKCVPVLGEV